MKIRQLLTLAASLLFLGTSAHAAKKPGLEPFAGSYSGRVISKWGATSLSDNATLTFTGKKRGLSGTFLYNGILNRSGVAQRVDQTFTLKSQGAVTGRVTVGDQTGAGAGKVRLQKKTLKFSLTYQLDGTMPVTITLVGKVVFAPKRAVMTATVSSSDASFNGSLKVTGRR